MSILEHVIDLCNSGQPLEEVKRMLHALSVQNINRCINALQAHESTERTKVAFPVLLEVLGNKTQESGGTAAIQRVDTILPSNTSNKDKNKNSNTYIIRRVQDPLYKELLKYLARVGEYNPSTENLKASPQRILAYQAEICQACNVKVTDENCNKLRKYISSLSRRLNKNGIKRGKDGKWTPPTTFLQEYKLVFQSDDPEGIVEMTKALECPTEACPNDSHIPGGKKVFMLNWKLDEISGEYDLYKIGVCVSNCSEQGPDCQCSESVSVLITELYDNPYVKENIVVCSYLDNPGNGNQVPVCFKEREYVKWPRSLLASAPRTKADEIKERQDRVHQKFNEIDKQVSSKKLVSLDTRLDQLREWVALKRKEAGIAEGSHFVAPKPRNTGFKGSLEYEMGRWINHKVHEANNKDELHLRRREAAVDLLQGPVATILGRSNEGYWWLQEPDTRKSLPGKRKKESLDSNAKKRIGQARQKPQNTPLTTPKENEIPADKVSLSSRGRVVYKKSSQDYLYVEVKKKQRSKAPEAGGPGARTSQVLVDATGPNIQGQVPLNRTLSDAC